LAYGASSRTQAIISFLLTGNLLSLSWLLIAIKVKEFVTLSVLESKWFCLKWCLPLLTLHWSKLHATPNFKRASAGCWWLMPVIPATQEVEIRRIEAWSQPEQIVQETLFQKKPFPKRVGGVAQGVGLEFKSQLLPLHQKKKKKKESKEMHFCYGPRSRQIRL
jgi:hypothetical protein